MAQSDGGGWIGGVAYKLGDVIAVEQPPRRFVNWLRRLVRLPPQAPRLVRYRCGAAATVPRSSR